MTNGFDDLHQEAYEKSGFWGQQAAGCIIHARSTGRFLIARRSDSEDVLEPGTWGTWGGAMDPGEDPLTTVRREIVEETGYDGAIDEILPAYVFERGDFRYSNFIVVVEDEFEPLLNWESDDFRWCAEGEWPTAAERHFGLSALLRDDVSRQLIADLSQSVSARIRGM